MRDLIPYTALHVGGVALWLWLLGDKSLTSSLWTLGLVGVAVAALVAVVLPRYRRTSHDTDGMAPDLIVHLAGGDTQRVLRRRRSLPGGRPEDRNGSIDIHGTG